MRWSAFVLVAVLCASCEPAVPGLAIVAVHPLSITAGETRTVQVELNTVPPFVVDYEQDGSEVSTVAELRLGSRMMEPAKYVGHSRFAVSVGPNFPQGAHDVWLKLEDGREALLPQGFRVYEAISGLWIETIPPQLQETPFDLVIHASGDDSEHFEGTVTVSTSKGQFIRPGNDPAKSFQTGNFSQGIRVERLAIDTPGSIVITVDDGVNSPARSNAFIVDAKQSP
jgi:hypothetical protein